MANHAAAIRAENPFPVARRGRQLIEFDLGNDKRRFVMVSGKIHYGVDSDLEIDDAWQPSIAPWDFEMVQNDFQVVALAQFNAGQIIKYTHQSDASLGLQPQQLQWTNDLDQISAIADPQNVDVTAVDNMLEWIGAYGAGLDFQWFCRHDGLSKYLVINDLAAISAPPQFIIDGGNPVLRLQFIFQKSQGIDIFVNGEIWDEEPGNPVETAGIIDWRDSVSDEVLWGFHVPVADNSDSTEEAETSITGNFRLRKTGPDLFVEVRVPWDWLEAAVYPVYVDANFTDQPAEASSKDTHSESTDPDNNSGTDVKFKTKTTVRHGEIEFDVSSISDSATCDAATLSLWSEESAITKTYGIYSRHSNVATWTELGLTWNNYKADTAWPGSGGGLTGGTDFEADASAPTIVFPNSSANTEATADLTSGNNLTAARIAGWFGAGNTNYGLVIGITGDADTRDWHSSGAATAGYRPKISIDYTVVAGLSIPAAMHYYRNRRMANV